MIDYLSKERLGIMLTTQCTLKCRGCYLMIPEQKIWNAEIDTIIAALPKIFQIFDRFEQICLMGGEPFLYKDLDKILEALSPYKEKFGFVRIVTNATVVPNQRLIDVIKSLDYHLDIRISDYGPHSYKLESLMEVLKKNELHTTIVHYNDDEQYHGGWIEFGTNWEYRNYTPQRLKKLYDNCNYKTFFNWGTTIYRCPTVSGAARLNRIQIPEEDVIALFDDQDVASKRAKVEKLVSRPIDACKYCDSFDAENGVRFKAGEQIGG